MREKTLFNPSSIKPKWDTHGPICPIYDKPTKSTNANRSWYM